MNAARARSDQPIRRLMTLKQAAEYMGRSIWGMRELVWKKKIPTVRLDRRVQVDVRDLDRLIDNAKEDEAP